VRFGDSNLSPGTTIRHREATRLISTAMSSSGAWLNVIPDNTTRNEFKSMHFEVALQRHLGYIASRKLGLRLRLFVRRGKVRSTTMATKWPMGASTIAAITR
jgi:hypothetical protein